MTPGTNRVNLLFTSAGRRVELLRAFRNSYAELQLPGKIVVTDIDPLAPALQVADQYHLVQRNTSPDYIPVLVEICRSEAIDAIFPLIDPDILILANHRHLFEAVQAKVAVVPLPAAQTTRDKWLTYHFFKSLHLSTPHTWQVEDLAPSKIDFPCFIKPRAGSAAQFAFRVENRDQLAFFAAYVPDPIVQEFIEGVEITCDIICDLDGKLLGIAQRQRMEVRSGEVAKGKTVFHQSVHDGCIQIAEALPAIGPITVQCILRDNIPYFTEINARMGGGLPLAIAAGVNAPKWLLAHLAGQSLTIPPLGDYQQGLYMTRFDDVFYLDENARHEIASRHL